MNRTYIPRAFRVAPGLRADLRTAPPTARHALLINPFYPKDPRASFGKHVLTPTLALTSVAGATPTGWTVRYWDENLLQGAPPIEPCGIAAASSIKYAPTGAGRWRARRRAATSWASCTRTPWAGRAPARGTCAPCARGATRWASRCSA